MFSIKSKALIGLLLSTFSVSALADCNEWTLNGNWRVFYRDNVYPTSVLAADEMIAVSVNGAGKVDVSLSDPDWQGWTDAWEITCIDDQPVLLGAIQQRRGNTVLVIEISRVSEDRDLLRLANGERKSRQVNIRFPQPFAMMERGEVLRSLASEGVLSSHPGHAHGWD